MSAIQLVINNRSHDVDIAPDTPVVMGAARQTQYDRYEVRLRYGTLRCLHRAPGWRSGTSVPDCRVIGRFEKNHNHRRIVGG